MPKSMSTDLDPLTPTASSVADKEDVVDDIVAVISEMAGTGSGNDTEELLMVLVV